MSQKTPITSEIERFGGSRGPISRAYQQERLISEMYDFVVGKFLEKEASGELSRADLARLSGKSPAQISRILATPGNWQLSTIAALLLAIDEEKLVPKSASIHERGAIRNFTAYDLLKGDTRSPPSQLDDQKHDGLNISESRSGGMDWELPVPVPANG